MDVELMKAVGRVAGVVGVLTTLVIIVFREIIRKNIFPQLTKRQAYKILLAIVFLSFSVSCFGIYAWLTSEKTTHTFFKFTIYLDSIPWKQTSVEIPEKEFKTITNDLGEVKIPFRGNTDQKFKLLIGDKYIVSEAFDNTADKNIFLQSAKFKKSEIAGVILKVGKPQANVKIVTEYGDSTKTNESGEFRFEVRSQLNQNRIHLNYSQGHLSKRALVPIDQTDLTLDL